MTKAAIFDVDGTLVDSVDLHASAWQEALVKFGHNVTFEQARSQIGKGGDQLIPVFLSKAEERDHGAEMEDWRSKLFRSKYLPLVRPFSAVPELLRRVREAGLQVAVASSAKKSELEVYLADRLHQRSGRRSDLVRGRRAVQASPRHLPGGTEEAGH
jgi:phosphoglycolate phosphatase-like HAD superfamily hydrolase